MLEHWQSVALRATALGSKWVHAPPAVKATKPVDQERLLPLYLPTPTVTPTVTSKRRKTQVIDFIWVFSRSV